MRYASMSSLVPKNDATSIVEPRDTSLMTTVIAPIDSAAPDILVATERSDAGFRAHGWSGVDRLRPARSLPASCWTLIPTAPASTPYTHHGRLRPNTSTYRYGMTVAARKSRLQRATARRSLRSARASRYSA